MTIREAHAKARLPVIRQHNDRLVVVLLERADAKEDRRCVVCGLVSPKNEARFVIPVTYIAACLVTNNLSKHFADVPLRAAFLCHDHRDTFDALSVDQADPSWDVARLERRAEVLGGVLVGNLLVFGGNKAIRVAREFQASVVALKRSVERSETRQAFENI